MHSIAAGQVLVLRQVSTDPKQPLKIVRRYWNLDAKHSTSWKITVNRNTLLVIAGLGAWVLFFVSIEIGGFDLLTNLVGTQTSNWLLLISLVLAIIAGGLMTKKLAELGAMTLPMISGILGMVLVATVVVLALLRAWRYA